ncbi:CHAT domain-containing protein [Streptosporangium roseum]|uniref:CHAT domain-containing protein n=1 Tax=Streptosporangium roseum TaxID=2001 RepID=UPI003323DAB0
MPRIPHLDDLRGAIPGIVAQVAGGLPAGVTDNRAQAFNIFSAMMFARWSRDRDPRTLIIAALFSADAEALVEAHPEQRAAMLRNLDHMIIQLIDIPDIDAVGLAAILAHGCVTATAPGDPQLAGRLNSLAAACRRYWKLTEDLGILRHAVRWLRAAVDLEPGDPQLLGNLGLTLSDLASHTGDLATRDEAVGAIERAERAEGAESADILATLGSALLSLGGHTGDPDVLGRSTRLLRRALDAPGTSPSVRPQLLNDLGVSMSRLAELTNDAGLAAESVDPVRQALALTSPDDPILPMRHANLAVVLKTAFESTGEIGALAEAAEEARRSVTTSPADHPARPRRLRFLARALMRLYERDIRREVIDEAVDRAQEALDTASEVDGTSRAPYLLVVADALWFRYEATGDRDDLWKATGLFRAVLERAEPGDDLHSEALHHLCSILLMVADDVSVDLAIVQEAVTVAETIVRGSPPGSYDRAVGLSNSGSALHALYRRTGDRATLTRAIQVLQQAAEANRKLLADTQPSRDNRVKQLSGFVGVLITVYQVTGDTQAIGEAVRRTREAIGLLGAGHREHVPAVGNLAACASLLAGLTGEREQVEEAASLGLATLDDLPEGFHRRSWLAGSVGGAFSALYEITRDPSHHREAVRCLRLARELTSDGPFAPYWMLNLAAALIAGRSPADLDEGIALLDAALERVSDEDPLRSAVQVDLAVALLLRGGEDAERGERLAMEAVLNGGTPAKETVTLAWHAGSRAAERGEWPRALAAFTAGVAALPRAGARALVREDQEGGLAEAQGMASTAAACALHLGEVNTALELLEAGRGILLGQGLENRADVSRLRRIRSDLADRFEALRGPAGPAELDIAARIAARHGRDHDWAALLAEIRAVGGETDFLKPPGAESAPELGRHGPVVLLNATVVGCAAILATERGVSAVNLPDLHVSDVQAHATALMDGMINGRMDDRAISAMLEWLWETAAAPVLNALDLASPGSRLWWCPTGLLTFLPIHAAGLHTRGDGMTVMDRCVSSYIPTLRSLRHLRDRPRPRAEAPRPLAVGLSDAGLKQQRAELDELRRTLGAELLRDTDATRENVLKALGSHDWIHCAGHATTDLRRPSSSGLVVHDGVVTVTDLAELDLRHGELAYLSACSTTQNAPNLADEALHITGALQLAGYRHVIGTLWPIYDEVAARVAGGFYAARPPGGGADADWAAGALHRIVRKWRDAWPDHPSRWAAFIHVGP